MAKDGDEGWIRTTDTTLLRLLYRGGLHRALVLRPPLSYLHHLLSEDGGNCGGVTGIRTPDLFHAMEPLSQLSYNPVIVKLQEGREAIPRPGAVICRLSPDPLWRDRARALAFWSSLRAFLQDVKLLDHDGLKHGSRQ